LPSTTAAISTRIARLKTLRPLTYLSQLRSNVVADSMRAWRRSARDRKERQRHDAKEQPLRSELFSIEQLERHAKLLAEAQEIADASSPDRLIPRLDENERVLVRAYELVTAAVENGERLAPAAEWLLDNFYLIEEQIRTARRHLPASYSRELPRLARGPLSGYPRVYAIALELIAHADGRVDAGSLHAFVAAYQTIKPLKLGELWALSIAVRLALIENLRRVAARVAATQQEQDLAHEWANRMLRAVEQNPSDLIVVMADMARAPLPFSGAFLGELRRHLQGQSPHFTFVHSWLEHRLAQQGQTIEQLVQADGQAQAADQVSIGNSIGSLRVLVSSDWRDFVETHSEVERILREDPSGVYAQMDFATRDRCRHAVEQIARRSPLTEVAVAREAVHLARVCAAEAKCSPCNHVGYHLIDEGRAALERSAQTRSGLRSGLRSALIRMGPAAGSSVTLGIYLGAALLIAALASWAFIDLGIAAGILPLIVAILAIPMVICASQLGVGFVNWCATVLVPPRPLPRMDFRRGIPAQERTIVVMPTMFSTVDGVERLIESLEVLHLANRDPHLHFGLLVDFRDSPAAVVPGDEELLRAACEGVEELNRAYEHLRSDIFFLFVRPRRWNEQEGQWMGYERKRGKLSDFNTWLAGGASTEAGAADSAAPFTHIIGDTSTLATARYVITLDTDTQLPRESARRMIEAMAHPLNRPVLNRTLTRVVRGYGIMQPRVGVSLPSAQRSWYVALFAGDAGIDPYTRMVSDVYQDLFGEGSFIGKGIYDLSAFRQTCEQFPDNTILSHDLIESAYARSALLSDVELYEDHPSRYIVDANRRSRWIRGDWQILWWLFPRVPSKSGRLVRNPISLLARWKMFDNLRRSLVPPALMLLLIGTWLGAPALAPAALLVVVAVLALVPTTGWVRDLARKPHDLPVSLHLRTSLSSIGKQALKVLVTLTLLPHESLISVQAIGRSLLRMIVTRRSLLEWTTASDAERSARDTFGASVSAIWSAPACSLITSGLLLAFQPECLPLASPLLVLWFIAPTVAWLLSRQHAAAPAEISDGQRVFLEMAGRRTWRFFEQFVTAEDNWLPPDNVQEHATNVIASRTSPTNIGMALLADLAAHDFGYCSTQRLLERIGNTFKTLGRMERYRGHLYNWYDTRTLKPLFPLYISTVDSGNLAGHLQILRSGLLEMIDGSVLPQRLFGGMRDTVRVLLEDAEQARSDEIQAGAPAVESGHRARGAPELIRRLAALDAMLGEPAVATNHSIRASVQLLSRIASEAQSLVGLIESDGAVDADLAWWAATLERSCVDYRNDVLHVVPWGAGAEVPEDLLQEPAAAGLHALLARLDANPTLHDIVVVEDVALPLIDTLQAVVVMDATSAWLTGLRQSIIEGAEHAAARIKSLEQLASQCLEYGEMDFTFLLDPARDLFAIGYNVGEHRFDAGYYDLLASEARFSSFIAIARGQIGQENWFALSRLLTTTGRTPALLSWSGSMFEYLMPLLVMPTFESTLLDQTYHAAVQRQVSYARQREIPWGMSESGYYTTDAHMNYQYRAFGVPGLGLKRGLADDLVVAPYASALALMVTPGAACRNLELLAKLGCAGAFGFYEAVDYTPSRLPRRSAYVIVRQFMAHHQGMTLLSLAYLLLGRPMQRRFVSDPMLRATVHLLQERVPRALSPIFPHAAEASATRMPPAEEQGTMRIFTDPSDGPPEVNLLSNGRYHVAVTNAGSGYSRWRDVEVTRWREDPTRDCWGAFCYLRDLDTNVLWSTSWQPTARPSKRHEAIFTQARAEFRRLDARIETHTEISVSPEDDIELRRVTITNRSDTLRTIEVTSYAEVVLAPAGQDLSHSAFSNLFVQTELVRNRHAIFCTRRPRSAQERPPWMTHLMTCRGQTVGNATFETDRMKFIGRGRTLASPAAMDAGTVLTDSAGPVLDPIVSIRQVLSLRPNESVIVDLVTGVAESRSMVEALTEKYSDPRLADRVFDLASTHSQILLRQLSATEAEAQAYGRLAGSIIFASSLRRAKASVLLRNRRGQSGLWGYGISGDLPIVLVRIRDAERLELVRQAVRAHAYWRMKGLAVDLVIWNEDDSVYHQVLQRMIIDLVAASTEAALFDKPAGIFVRRGEQMSEEDRSLLQTVARVVLLDEAGTFAEQSERRDRSELFIPAFTPIRTRREPKPNTELSHDELIFANGIGGFSADGREYIIQLEPGQQTPAPWVNVIANQHFGTVVSEGGSAYTWWNNSHEFRITPWYNDPVTDVSGEAMYMRDEESGRVWSATPLPAPRSLQRPDKEAPSSSSYVVRHGFGYSVFEHADDGIVTELCVFVAPESPLKFARLRITNDSGRRRQLSATAYWEWVLGELRTKTLMHVVTELDPMSGAIFARNPYSTEFADRVVFVDCSEQVRTVTGDRTEFLGRNGSPADPAALRRARLSGRVGAGLDPCAAIQAPFTLEQDQEKEIVFLLGSAGNEDEARRLLRRYRNPSNAQRALDEVGAFWTRTLGGVQFETPDPAVNIMANGWLLYQSLSCRMWGRTGFYQSGGAYGFRDQLQDLMALLYAHPVLCRDHLLRCAGRQFREGDVQHWWHPPGGRGVRTHISDDYLWLPAVTCRYVAMLGDTGVLDERVPFLEGRPVRPEEDAYYDLPRVSEHTGTLYEHCLAAIDNGLRFGEHGLPLMGSGDWNDGMNLVGEHGKGESVWLGFFLYHVLTRFIELATKRADSETVARLTMEAERLRINLETHGWDGEWYRRAYFDDGTPLGSQSRSECQIDAIAQSWSVLSGAGAPERTRRAMESVMRRLVGVGDRSIRLLDPPFDQSEMNPGYIKGYVPGVRENGGQYNHAAIWTIMAFAALGDVERAWELLQRINPVTLAGTAEALATYRVEPYVVAADIYTVPPHTGRGGWTWYTGSAGLMYRLIAESLLGLRLEVDQLRIAPLIPRSWTTYKIHYRYRETMYHITIRNAGGGPTVRRVMTDGVEQPTKSITLLDDRRPHEVEVEVG